MFYVVDKIINYFISIKELRADEKKESLLRTKLYKVGTRIKCLHKVFIILLNTHLTFSKT